MENHGVVLVWFERVKRLETAGKQGVFCRKQEPRRLRERAGFERNPMNDSVLELPARGHGIEALAHPD
jgi:hypothetical protein